MREIHLDTNFLVAVATHSASEDALLRGWLGQQLSVRTSTVAWAEFLCGPLTPDARASVLGIVGEPIPLTADHASRAADLFSATGRRRGSLNDCLIAAIALQSGAELATSDATHFRRFVTLGLEIAG